MAPRLVTNIVMEKREGASRGVVAASTWTLANACLRGMATLIDHQATEDCKITVTWAGNRQYAFFFPLQRKHAASVPDLAAALKIDWARTGSKISLVGCLMTDPMFEEKS